MKPETKEKLQKILDKTIDILILIIVNLKSKEFWAKVYKILTSKVAQIVYMCAIVAGVVGLIAINIFFMTLKPIDNISDLRPNVVTNFYANDGENIIKSYSAYTFEKLTLDEIPQNLENAFIAIEDKNFYKHKGYDFVGLVRSMIVNTLSLRTKQGASTITQQSARLLFLTNERTISRKIKEIVYAVRMEKSVPKKKILEIYLNNIFLGSGSYGVKAAAMVYFDKELKDLTIAECALLAGLPQAPSVYSPYYSLKRAKNRRDMVLFRMYKNEFITKEQYVDSIIEPIVLSPEKRVTAVNVAPHFADYVLELLEKEGFKKEDIKEGGYKVITTLDFDAQVEAQKAVTEELEGWGLKDTSVQGAMFMYSPQDGRIYAYVGGKDFEHSQYDRITQGIRPPGSAFKPFVYATAIQHGVDPNEMMEDTPVKIGGWKPHNYGYSYRGKMPMYMGLMISSNVIAARLIEIVRPENVIKLVRTLGITTPLEEDSTIALGSNAVNLYEMVRAYGAFANGGYLVEPYAVEKVYDNIGNLVYEAPEVEKVQVMDSRLANIVVAMMRNVVQGGTGGGAYFGMPLAGKTGTTDSYKDACFYGYTPALSAGVWMGFDDNSKLPGLTGGTIPAVIFKRAMSVASKKIGYKNFNGAGAYLKSFDLKAADRQTVMPWQEYVYKDSLYDENDETDEDGHLKKLNFEVENKLKNKLDMD